MSRVTANLYNLPQVYDILHAPGTSHDVQGLERMAARFVRTRPRSGRSATDTWLEPACGTARLLRAAARRGHAGIGFDLNAAMLDYARRAAPPPPAVTIRLELADMTDFASIVGERSIDFAFNLINTIRHLESDAAMLAHFEQISRVLRPGGAYAVGIGLCVYGVEPPTEDIWRAARGRCRVTQVIQYAPAPSRRSRWEQVVSSITVRTPRQTQHIDSAYRLRTYDMAQWRRLIDRSALTGAAWVDEWGSEIAMVPPGYAIHVLKPR